MTAVTKADLTRFQAELARNDRAGFYLDYYNITGDAQILALAQISSFSGVAGNAAQIANAFDAAVATNYPAGGVESFSLSIATNVLAAVTNNVNAGGTGLLSNTSLLSIPANTWNELQLGQYFPGNALAAESFFVGLFGGDNSYYESTQGAVFSIGTVAGLLSGGLGLLEQAGSNYQNMLAQNIDVFLNALLLNPAVPSQSIPAGMTRIVSNDGTVSWLISDTTGNVVYGSVKTPSLIQLPQVYDTIQIVIPSPDGVASTTLFLNSDGSGSFSLSGNQLSYLPGDLINLTESVLGNVLVKFRPTIGTGPAETAQLSNSGITTTIGNNSFSETLANTKASLTAQGGITFVTPLNGFGSSTLTIGVTGTDVFGLGADELAFQGNSLTSVSYLNGNFVYGLVSPAPGYTQTLTWNPASGMASDNLTSSSGQGVSTPFVQVNPGSVLTVNGSAMTYASSAGQVTNSIQLEPTGGQIDTVLSTSGSTAGDSTATFLNSSGNKTEVLYDNTNNNDVADFYSPSLSEALIAQQFLNSNGSGEVLADSDVINYAAGNLVSVAGTNSGSVSVAFTPANGTGYAATLSISSSGISENIAGSNILAATSGTEVSDSSSGAITYTNPAPGFRSSILTIADNGSAIFSVGSDQIDFTAGSLLGVSYASNTASFAIASALPGDSEGIAFNYVTGQEFLTTTPLNGPTTSILIGQENPTNILNVSSSSVVSDINLETSTGTTLAAATVGGGEEAVAQENGSTQIDEYAQASGTQELATTLNVEDQATQQTMNPLISADDLEADTADTLATQLITEVLIKDNIPAAIAAQAGVEAVTQIATHPNPSLSNFDIYLATDALNIAGGIGGSTLGSVIAKDLGLPAVVGSIPGGVTGSLLTQSIVNSLGKDFGITSSTQAVLTVANFTANLAGAAGGEAGQLLASLVTPPTITGQITGAVAATAVSVAELVSGFADAILFTNPVTGAIAIFATVLGSDFIGNLIGDAVSGLFGSSGNPFGESNLYFANGGFYLADSSTDNGGSVQTPEQMGSAAVSLANQILKAIGGTDSSTLVWSIGYKGNQYLSFAPGGAYTYFGDPNSDIDSVAMTLIKSTSIIGGNPLMKFVLAQDRSTGVQTLLDDITVAHDYGEYAQNPLAFDLAMAEAGSSISLQAWETEDARAQVLGLNNLSFNGTTLTIQTSLSQMPSLIAALSSISQTFTFADSDTSPTILANIATLLSLQAKGELASVTYTDAATPTISLTAGQFSTDEPVLRTVTTNTVLDVIGVSAANAVTVASNFTVTKIFETDNAANFVVNIDSLQTVYAENKLGSVNLTDTGTPTLSLSQSQMSSDASVLGLISQSYAIAAINILAVSATTLSQQAHITSVGIVDTAANIDANLVSEEALAKLGKITSITPVDGSTNNLILTTSQLGQDADALNKLTSGSFGETVSITPASISGNISGTTGGHDILSFINSASAVTVNLASGGTAIMGSNVYHISGFQSVVGSQYADVLSASSANDTLTGGGGSDILVGYASGSTVFSDTAAHLNGTTISNFTATDFIDLSDFVVGVVSLGFKENAANTLGILALGNGGKTTSITISGQHTANQFFATPAGVGGSMIGYTASTGAPLAAFQAAHPNYTFG